MNVATGDSLPSRPTLGSLVASLWSVRSYTQLAYLLLAIPLGFIYWFVLGFGLVFGLLTAVVGVGLLVLFITLIVVRLIGDLERWLANALLAVDLETPDDRPEPDGLWDQFASYLAAPSSWRSFGFLQLKFLYMIVGIVVLFVGWTALDLLTTPLRYPTTLEFGEVNGEPVTWAVDTLPEAAAAVPLGLALVLVVLALANGFGYVAGQMAEALLDADRSEGRGAHDHRDGDRGEDPGGDGATPTTRTALDGEQ